MAFGAGIVLDDLGIVPDHWIHDAAVVHQARSAWPHVAIVAFDRDIPMQVGRRQALPLVARAAERLIEAGAKGIFLDVRLAREQEPAMPYALCLEVDGKVRWSRPRCFASEAGVCRLSASEAGMAPLAMSRQTLSRLWIAPFLDGQEDWSNFLLFGPAAEGFGRPLTADDVLVGRDPSVMRWMPLDGRHAVVQMARLADPAAAAQALRPRPEDERCQAERRCRRVRFSPPLHRLQPAGSRTFFPLSRLAACDVETARRAADPLRGKVVILQLTGPAEATDLVVTPMTTAWNSPHMLTSGAQYLADAIETLLHLDHPRSPPEPAKWVLWAGVAGFSVWLGLRRGMIWLWGWGALLALGMMALCFWVPRVQLWPVSATLATYLVAAVQVTGLQILVGFREGRLIQRYMPPPVHDLLITAPGCRFRNQRYRVIVLQSDLANYTTVTSLLQDPVLVLTLMNDYLEATAQVLQSRYQGWLESYVGDMVCYYWPVWQDWETTCRHALTGAMELADLQSRFFDSLPDRYQGRLPPGLLKSLRELIDAGIGLAGGMAVMGDLGPRHGVRRFGLLGDPLNLAARLEALTRHFGDTILADDSLARMAPRYGLCRRRLGTFRLKGRPEPARVFALGAASWPRFAPDRIAGWETWLTALERGLSPLPDCPEIYARDRHTLLTWWKQGRLRDGIWEPGEK
ncbi:adenylate/guanylate cyclase domain-containing protein [Methylomarinovum caldicuralii]|nr:adenylate/guanylate cyclase domain-containing protein [Methylomarinovum caldicuralii]